MVIALLPVYGGVEHGEEGGALREEEVEEGRLW